MCEYGEALELFEMDRWAPYDQTRSYWYRADGEFYYSENDDLANPEKWDGGGYSSERVREYVERGSWVLVTLDDSSGGQFQAIFSLDKQIDPEDFE